MRSTVTRTGFLENSPKRLEAKGKGLEGFCSQQTTAGSSHTILPTWRTLEQVLLSKTCITPTLSIPQSGVIPTLSIPTI